ncbi:MAG: hypothetical protein AAB598_02265 [Patescibacteria group bacterium]
MSTIIKKGIQIGLGAYVKTRKEIEGVVSELIKKNTVSKKKGKKMIARMLAQSKKIEKKAEEQVRRSLLSAVKTLKSIAKKDLDLLERKLTSAKRK